MNSTAKPKPTPVSVRLDADVMILLNQLRRATGKTGDQLLNQCVRLNAGALLRSPDQGEGLTVTLQVDRSSLEKACEIAGCTAEELATVATESWAQQIADEGDRTPGNFAAGVWEWVGQMREGKAVEA